MEEVNITIEGNVTVNVDGNVNITYGSGATMTNKMFICRVKTINYGSESVIEVVKNNTGYDFDVFCDTPFETISVKSDIFQNIPVRVNAITGNPESKQYLDSAGSNELIISAVTFVGGFSDGVTDWLYVVIEDLTDLI